MKNYKPSEPEIRTIRPNLDMTMACEIIKTVMRRLQSPEPGRKDSHQNEALLEQERQALEDLCCRKTQKAMAECQRVKDRYAELSRRLDDADALREEAEAERDELQEQLETVRKAAMILNAA